MIYLDNAATTPLRREVAEAIWPVMTRGFGNPSSHHRVGEAAAATLKAARARIAGVLGCRPGEITLTGGGTEAANLAVKGLALGSPRGRHIVSTALEHEAVLESCDYLRRLHGFEITLLTTDTSGRVDPAELARVLRPDSTLVTVHYANNEIGTVQPIRELAAIARAAGVPFHTDAVQAAGWLELNVVDLGVDALSISGHKLGAPQGVGALYLRGRLQVEPVLHGGGQERGRRSGTENVAGAVGLAVALDLAEAERRELAPALTVLRDGFVAAVLESTPGAALTGDPLHRLPGHASFTFAGTGGEAVLLELERHDIVCSSGSACAAGSDEASHVLTALGIPADLAQTAVRFTLSATTTAAELTEAATRVREAVAAVRGLAG
ncbi:MULTISPECIES: cysteine desulfurase family protein [Cryobacterium]|uniref:cysteine desulfurase family protein n=1 Tax=Cryobacterium TaxID=69578 RepID=UPI000CD3F3CD|nr:MULTISPECIES: cysteine desulfurase family protein [Cryobacterium]POH63262.1 cysteine desulfurase [Cryobacterium zongtaii]TFC47140.1 cysteine desulfurase [Cryobacterium sp. TMN-39-2]